MYNKRRTHASYRSLYRVKPVLYYFGDIQLPFPISVERFLIFAVVNIVFYVLFVELLGPILTSLGLVPWMISVSMSVLATWLTTKFDAAGKFIPKYLSDALLFLARSKTSTLHSRIKIRKKKEACNWKVDVSS